MFQACVVFLVFLASQKITPRLKTTQAEMTSSVAKTLNSVSSNYCLFLFLFLFYGLTHSALWGWIGPLTLLLNELGHTT